MSTIPLIMTSAGAVAVSPATAQQTILTTVQATNPDYTSNLPGTLVEDILSTQVAGVVQCSQAQVDAINSVSPYGANAFVLAQLGAQFGIAQGLPSNTNAYVVFSGTAGYVIPAGFIVSDGSYQYIVQDGGIVGISGTSAPVYVVANQSGTWSVNANTITTVVSPIAPGYTLTVTNPTSGTPGTTAESVQSYRSRVTEAFQMTGQGVAGYLQTAISAVPGVQPRLVAINAVPGGWTVIAGGGDPYQVAYAIYTGVLDLSTLQGSQVSSVRNVTGSIGDYQNIYTITYVNPPQESVNVAATWATNLANFTNTEAVNQAGSVAIQNYVNSIQVGQPINLLDMTNAFQSALTGLMNLANLSSLTFVVEINGVVTTPTAGTQLVYGDPESYFYLTGGSVVQG